MSDQHRHVRVMNHQPRIKGSDGPPFVIELWQHHPLPGRWTSVFEFDTMDEALAALTRIKNRGSRAPLDRTG